MLQNLLSKISSRKQAKLAKQFNKVAMIGNAAITGYFAGGPTTSIISSLIIAFSDKVGDALNQHHLTPPIRQRLTQNVRFHEFLDLESVLGKRIDDLREEMGVKHSIEIAILEGSSSSILWESGVPSILTFSPHILHSFSEDEIISIAAHEFAHALEDDATDRDNIKKASLISNSINLGKGVMETVLFLNPLPAIIGGTGWITNKYLRSRNEKLGEHYCDATASEVTNVEDYYSALRKVFDSSRGALNSAIDKRSSFENFSEKYKLKSLLQKLHLEKIINKAIINIEGLFKRVHPQDYKRISSISKSALKQGIDLDSSPKMGAKKIELCSHCTGAETQKEQDRLASYVRNEFQYEYGHTDVKLNFRNACGNKSSFKKLLMGSGSGSVIIIRTFSGPD